MLGDQPPGREGPTLRSRPLLSPPRLLAKRWPLPTPPFAPAATPSLAGFVSDNARRLLSLDAPSVLPVSSKAALRAKLECGSAVHSGAMDTVADDLLQDHPAWQASK
jgi:hypothetical protein